jgi:hypothetical protein
VCVCDCVCVCVCVCVMLVIKDFEGKKERGGTLAGQVRSPS